MSSDPSLGITNASTENCCMSGGRTWPDRDGLATVTYHTAAQAPTSLTAAPQFVLFPPPPSIGFGNLSATLTSNGSPVTGRTIAFSIGWLPLCTSVTNASGATTCQISFLGELIVLIAGGYSATFAGDNSYLSSSGATSWIALGSGLAGTARSRT